VPAVPSRPGRELGRRSLGLLTVPASGARLHDIGENTRFAPISGIRGPQQHDAGGVVLAGAELELPKSMIQLCVEGVVEPCRAGTSADVTPPIMGRDHRCSNPRAPQSEALRPTVWSSHPPVHHRWRSTADAM